MKFLSKLFMKRQRRSDEDPAGSAIAADVAVAANGKKKKSGGDGGYTTPPRCSHRRRGRHHGALGVGGRRRNGNKDGQLGSPDTSSSQDDTASSLSDNAPWRVENILVAGPPSTRDWWENPRLPTNRSLETSFSSFDTAGNSFEDFPDDTAGRARSDFYATGKRFRNIGRETWVQVRRNWKRPVSTSSALAVSSSGGSNRKSPPTSPAPPPARSYREKIKKNVAQCREYSLRRPVALSDMIEIYNEIWNEDGDE